MCYDVQVYMMTMTMDGQNNRTESSRISMVSMEKDEEILSCHICGYKCGIDTMLLHHNNDHNREREFWTRILLSTKQRQKKSI